MCMVYTQFTFYVGRNKLAMYINAVVWEYNASGEGYLVVGVYM